MPFTLPGPCFRPVLLFVLLTSIPLPAATPADAWRALADSRPQDALRLLKSLPDGREKQLIHALALTHQQPVTDEALRQAEVLLVSLGAGEDDIALQAHYLQARLHQVHYAQPDPARAAELYAALATRRPDSHWAQLALVKLAMLHLYTLPAPTGPESRLKQAEALLARLAEPELQRDLHLQIGQAGLHHGLPPTRVLPHLRAAERIGGVPGVAREDLILQIAELSLRVGDLATAREFFERYLRDYSVNPRCFTVRHRLRHLEELAAQEARP